jgi:hypothetical protein
MVYVTAKMRARTERVLPFRRDATGQSRADPQPIGSEPISFPSRTGVWWLVEKACGECRDRELTVCGHGLRVFVRMIFDELLDVRHRALRGRIGEVRL